MKNKERKLTPERIEQLEELCTSLGIKMDNMSLLDLALTHTSYAHEHQTTSSNEHNERLEFLGDSVLSIIVSGYMFINFPKFDEGKLTKLRAQVVCEASLAKCAGEIKLGQYANLGHGEEITGGRNRVALLADAFEAVLGAYYIDQGFEAAQKYVLNLLEPTINDICTGKIFIGDYKSLLQEFVQQDYSTAVIYNIVDTEGPEHNLTFTANVCLGDREIGVGTGRTKKEAEQHAAHKALLALQSGQVK